MTIFKKTIFTGFSPNLTGRDTWVALSYLLFPWKWKYMNRGKNGSRAEESLRKFFSVKNCYVFDSGRSALYFALKSVGIKEGDEVLVQAYTCMVVVNAIVQTGARPIFVDIGDDFNMDCDDLAKKITGKSKVVIIQHTFGLSADLDRLLRVARSKNLVVVEDCAHSFGARFKGKLVGTYGDLAMLSFGADKTLSCVRGGALITDNSRLGEKIKEFQHSLPQPRISKTIQHLLHCPFFYVGKKFYGLYLGKILLATAKKLHLINKIIYDQEKRGCKIDFYPSRLANSLAEILIDQLKNAEKINAHRKTIARFYNDNIRNEKIELPWKEGKIKDENCIYLRYPILVDDSRKLLNVAKRQGILLGDWYSTVIAPADIDMSRTKYEPGTCPRAEQVAPRSVNLPTDKNITIEDAQRIVAVINSFK